MTAWVKRMGRVSRRRLGLTGLVSGLSILLLCFGFAPIPRQQQEIELATARLLVDDEQKMALSFIEGQTLRLKWPRTMRIGEKSEITLQLLLDETGGQVMQSAETLPEAGREAYNVVMLARLDLAGFGAFQGETREPIRAGQSASLHWDLDAHQVGLSRGKVWFYLELYSAQDRDVHQVLVLARPIEIETRTVFGLPVGVARAAGLAGILLGSSILHPGLWKGRPQKRT